MTRRVFLLAVLLAASCRPIDPKPLPTPPEPPPVSTVAAADLCKHLRELGCPEGDPTPQGTPCEESIEHARRMTPMPEQCWLDAETRSEAIACGDLECAVP